MRFGPQEMLLLFLVVLLLFGAARLPKLARSMREARDEFRKGESDVPEAHTANPEPAPTQGATTPSQEPTQAVKDQPTSGT